VHTADERGITLQTLIVTAVLVLMAVAAGVVIVAITNSASDDLEEQTTSIEALCNGVEVYDPVLASSASKGRNGGQTSDRIGCIPVCVWEAQEDDDNEIGTAEGEIDFDRNLAATASPDDVDDVVAGNKFLFEDVNDLYGNLVIGDTAGADDTPDIKFDGQIAEVRVSPDQRSCRAYNSTGDIVA